MRWPRWISQGRIDLLCTRLPGWLVPVVQRYRYGVLAVLINLPGNTLISPIPLLFWLYGAPVLTLFS